MNSSGPISLAGTTAGVSIEIENGGNGTTQISLNDTAVRSLAGVTTPGSTIIMPTNFYGKANAFSYTISANQTNLCMRAGAVTAGWNQTLALVVTINAGVKVSSNSTGTPALTIAGAFPGGVSLINNGVVVAQGGCGGGGSDQPYSAGYARPGGGGGTAIKVCSPISVTNNGTISGGGGGGGGGSKNVDACNYGGGGGGGGGGRSGLTNSSGGPGGIQFGASPGSPGTYCAAGPGGPGSTSPFGCFTGGTGGSGGNWGAVGGSSGGSGGAGGKATCGAGPYITWVTTGTRNGSIS